eukprot:TRINITY_DN6466_c0_g1_i1.p1 TRINITY_DN6466_c0_g1~~TRINITY_DN6466_c0_g1_i1.p1  ORF type:complete len:398 (-),score=102.85 TRINITY_DN6466_c0_g1_i1:503-1696(-)
MSKAKASAQTDAEQPAGGMLAADAATTAGSCVSSSLPADLVRVVAEQEGVPGAALPEAVAAALASDAEYRLRQVVQEACKFMRRNKRGVLCAGDINAALRLANVEALYGFNFPTPMKFQRVAGNKGLYYVADPEVDLTSIIERPLPECPRDVALGLHWLAVEGVQPAIPQNPPPATTSAAGEGAAPPPAKRVKIEGTEVEPLVQHVLSKEMQLYYEAVVQSIRGTEEATVAALNSLQHDPGTAQLLPYLTRFVAEEIAGNLRHLQLLFNVMRLVRTLITSPHLHVEPYLHQLMPGVLTCIVGKQLCENPTDNHWALRDYAASIISLVCQKFGKAYESVQPRISRTLGGVLRDTSKPLTSHYGAIVGIASLGHNSVELLILPHVSGYCLVSVMVLTHL